MVFFLVLRMAVITTEYLTNNYFRKNEKHSFLLAERCGHRYKLTAVTL